MEVIKGLAGYSIYTSDVGGKKESTPLHPKCDHRKEGREKKER